MDLTHTPRPSAKLKLYPHVDLDLRVLQASRLQLREIVLAEADANPALEHAGESAANGADPALTEYLTSGDDGHADEGFTYAPDENADNPIERLVARRETLADHLRLQLHILPLTASAVALGDAIIGNLDDNGYLRGTLAEIAAAAGTDNARAAEALAVVQGFDPPGVAARDLKECLLLQLTARGREGSAAYRVVHDALDLLEKKQFARIAAGLGIPEESVHEALREIETLDPKPGRSYAASSALPLTPDAVLEDTGTGLGVTLTRDDLPALVISRSYRNLIARGTSPETRAYISERLQAARALIQAIHRRQVTLKAVIEAIVGFQRDHLQDRSRPPRPMTLEDIARLCERSPSTVSRAVHGKYLHTREGTVELRSLFHAGVRQPAQGSVSAGDIKARLRELVDGESAAPLSDEALRTALKAQGITVSRRAVTKYRQELGIPASLTRRR